jgi:hypothetical protein
MADSKALMSANDVHYQEQPAVAATTRRTLARIPALKDAYTDGDVMIINMETGSDFVDGCSSFLNFKVTTSETAALSSEYSSALDLFREVVVYARNGTELLRLPFFNVWSRTALQLQNSQEYLNTVASAFGYGDTATDHATGTTWSIPLKHLSDLFCSNQKLPPQLVSGMRIEIVLESAQKAFDWDNENAHSYTVSEIVLLADTHTMTDAISRKIMSDSASEGLVLQFTDFSHISQDVGGSATRSTVNFQKSVARASSGTVLVRADAGIDLNVGDSLATEAFDVKDSRYRIGSLYFPRQNLDRPTTHYLNNLRTYKQIQMHGDVKTALKFSDHKAQTIVATLLDRDDELENSGVSTSRAQGDLIAELSFNTPVARRLDCYVTYEKQLSIGLSSVLVNE